jgi:signal transduction histidine kinase
VTDNGAGFSKGEHEKAFERFYQSSPSTEGLGLGLNISRKIVESLGGTILIDSEGRNKGTTLSVTLPVVKVEAPDPAEKTLKEHS